ncbi:unnamed protein product [Soboliphyme baturini]|uniref:Tropomyosin n=1 Tax=Soboliphyme baturini TaxID=241478 RepID=A0A183JAC6_9BILA|nr:unnamed protein product [Soboliphyme baturini]
MEKVEVEYLQIGRDVEHALTVSDTTRHKVQETEEKRKVLEIEYNKTQELLQERIGNNNEQKARAESLRQQAGRLLENTEKHLNEIEGEFSSIYNFF